MSVIFSMIAAAKRQQLYREFYNSIAHHASVPFEIVFVGPNPPTEAMPSNFKYIQTNVKPTQCLEIAARSAVGEYLIVAGDDLRYSDGFLDRLYNYTLRLDMEKTLISSRYSLNDEIRDFQLVFSLNNPTALICGQSPLFKRQVWLDTGGIDHRFVCAMSDIDMQMRFYEYGFQPFVTPDCIMNEIVTLDDISQGTLYRKSGRSDTDILNSIWIAGGEFTKNRNSKVLSFSDDNILVSSQGGVNCHGKSGRFSWS